MVDPGFEACESFFILVGFEFADRQSVVELGENVARAAFDFFVFGFDGTVKCYLVLLVSGHVVFGCCGFVGGVVGFLVGLRARDLREGDSERQQKQGQYSVHVWRWGV